MTLTLAGISEAEYRELPRRFNPSQFDPNTFIDLARAAGQEYMVFTTKHHDGFCMFDSSYTDYKITNTPYGKDVVRQLADACQGRGIPPGFYYSPPDMHHTAFRDTTKLAKENWNGEPTRPEWPIYLEYMRLQLIELLTKYGPVALIWFDGLHKRAEFLIRSLVEVASRGSNFLLNVGPQPDGLIQPGFQQRLRAIGDWLAVNGESIYGTTYGPVQNMKSVRTTAKRGRLFLHIFDWPSSPLEISGLDTKVMSAHLLAGGQSLKYRQTEHQLQIDLPQQPPDPNVTVIAVRTL